MGKITDFKELEKNYSILKEKFEKLEKMVKEEEKLKKIEEELERREFEKTEWIKFEKNQEKNLETIKRLLEKIRTYIGENKNVKEFYNLDKLFKDVLREVTLMKGALIFKNELTEEQVENFTRILKELEKMVEELKLYK